MTCRPSAHGPPDRTCTGGAHLEAGRTEPPARAAQPPGGGRAGQAQRQHCGSAHARPPPSPCGAPPHLSPTPCAARHTSRITSAAPRGAHRSLQVMQNALYATGTRSIELERGRGIDKRQTNQDYSETQLGVTKFKGGNGTDNRQRNSLLYRIGAQSCDMGSHAHRCAGI